jgi:LmbE family N-acetylglucosaminyl deacetylase
MKYFISLLVPAILLALWPIASFVSANPSDQNTVIYFVPHADDEVLSFSVPILNDIRAGKKVYMVLMSPGEDSGAREVVNGQYDVESTGSHPPGKLLYCKWHKKYHQPLKEKYRDGHLTKAQFGLARIQEFYKSGAKLGIPKSQMLVKFLPNGKFNYHAVKLIILTYAKLFPDAQFKSFSSVDVMVDHAMVGKVLNDLYNERQIKKPQKIVSIATDRVKNKKVPGYKQYLSHAADKKKILNAVNHVYKGWNPQNGTYGMGYHSVSSQFNMMVNNTYSKISPY